MPHTCFWDTLCAKVPQFRDSGFRPAQAKQWLIKNNRKTPHVRRKTNHSPLKAYTEKQLAEGLEWRRTLVDTAAPKYGDKGGNWSGWQAGGHETGADDPWLALCVQLLRVRIIQRYNAPGKRTDNGKSSWVKCVVEYVHKHFDPATDPTITIDCSAGHAQ